MAKVRELVWLDDYVVGDERIDAEHKRLLELLFEIEGLIIGKGGAVVLKQRISDFLTMLKAHCAYEEGRMQMLSRDRFGDLVDGHCAQHAQLIEKSQSLLEAVGGDAADRARLHEAHEALFEQMRDLILDDFGLVGALPDKGPSETRGVEHKGKVQNEPGAPASIGMYLTAIVGAFLLLALILLGHTIQETTASIKSEISQSAHAISKGVANEINAVLLSNKDVMERMAKRPLMRRATQDECDKILWDFKEIFPRFANVTTIEPDGTALCSAVPQPGGKPVNVFKSEWFQRLIATQSFVVGKPFMGPITGRWVSVLASPVHDDQGAVIRYMGLPLDLVALTPSIAKDSLYQDSVVGVATDDGVIVWRSKDADAWVGKSLKEREAFSNFVDQGISETTIVGIDNVERTYYFDRVEASNWVVWVGVPRDVLKALWLKVLPSLALLGLLGLLFVAAILFMAAWRIVKPMRDLADTARAIQAGDNKARAMLVGPREVVAVAREFNALVDLREKQTDALIKSNVELKRFAFIASHDLQEPVRNVVAYSQLLERRYAKSFDAEGQEYFGFIISGAKRMHSLVRDLLTYSRISESAHKFSKVDMRDVVDEAVANLQSLITESGARVVIADGPYPAVQGDRMQLIEVLQNLVTNSLRFRKPEASPLVEIKVKVNPERAIFSVSDNGMGIEKIYWEQIFIIFKRLHGSTFPGTGLGLAICKRIIEAHGGRIWVESQPGVGSTFFFSLPVS